MKELVRTFYLNKIVYYIAGVASVIFVASYFFPLLFRAGILILILLGLLVLLDALLIFIKKDGVFAKRHLSDRFSIGDENNVSVQIQNNYNFNIRAAVIDELPAQFQERNWKRKIILTGLSAYTLEYKLRPVTRGEYVFHDINIYVQGPLRIVIRRFIFEQKQTVKVYPSFIQMRRYQLLAVSNKLQEAGVERIRKLGHSMEFEQIKEYVRGDDYRTINWKATGRKAELMVNNYTDERSQQIYCLINKGRVMKMPFDGMSLLDYAINASLVLSNVALVRQDKAGLITFEKNIDSFLLADKKPAQTNTILETLYNQQTDFLEADFEKLYSVVRNRITNRSLLVLFTNFESPESLQREMPALRRIAKYHLLLVVFFENTGLKKITDHQADTLEGIYIRTIAEKFAYEKRLMVKELYKNGIPCILTTPENLTVNTINKYLELKNKLSI
ncbi:MAG: DUF58 domain-containing protein [Chitinophagales bacterium]|nr:DUF58 domain-containing protein [Chitinophagales bacterium]